MANLLHEKEGRPVGKRMALISLLLIVVGAGSGSAAHAPQTTHAHTDSTVIACFMTFPFNSQPIRRRVGGRRKTGQFAAGAAGFASVFSGTGVASAFRSPRANWSPAR